MATPAGANSAEFDLGPIGVGQGRRTGVPAPPLPPLDLPCLTSSSASAAASAPLLPAASPAESSNGAGDSLIPPSSAMLCLHSSRMPKRFLKHPICADSHINMWFPTLSQSPAQTTSGSSCRNSGFAEWGDIDDGVFLILNGVAAQMMADFRSWRYRSRSLLIGC